MHIPGDVATVATPDSALVEPPAVPIAAVAHTGEEEEEEEEGAGKASGESGQSRRTTWVESAVDAAFVFASVCGGSSGEVRVSSAKLSCGR